MNMIGNVYFLKKFFRINDQYLDVIVEIFYQFSIGQYLMISYELV